MQINPFFRIGFLLFVLVTWSCSGPVKEEKSTKQYSMSQFMDIVQIAGSSFSPDESRLLFSSKETGIFNVFEIDIESGEKKQLTNSTDNAIFASSYFPEDNRIVVRSDKGGNEITHLFVQNPDGSMNDLIKDSTAKAQFYGWSYNQKLLYYTTNGRDKRYFDLYKVQIKKDQSEEKIYPTQLAYKNTDGLDPAAISINDRYIALVKSITTCIC